MTIKLIKAKKLRSKELTELRSKLKLKKRHQGRAEKEHKKLNVQVQELVRKIWHTEEQLLFDRMCKLKEVPWNKLCWPSTTHPAPGGGGLKKKYCIACKKEIGHGSYRQGSYMGSGLSFDRTYMKPNLYAHERCVPVRIKNVESIY